MVSTLLLSVVDPPLRQYGVDVRAGVSRAAGYDGEERVSCHLLAVEGEEQLHDPVVLPLLLSLELRLFCHISFCFVVFCRRRRASSRRTG